MKATVPARRQRVLPVPVGLSSNALSLFFKARNTEVSNEVTASDVVLLALVGLFERKVHVYVLAHVDDALRQLWFN